MIDCLLWRIEEKKGEHAMVKSIKGRKKISAAISIHESPSADSRTAIGPISKDDLLQSTVMHIEDVQQGLEFFRNELETAGSLHDYTKIEGIDEFYEVFEEHRSGDVSFTRSPWYQNHVSTERHHINDHVPDRVDLVDVLEMITDCVMAGMARSGEVYEITIDPEVLMEAFDNTVELLKDNVEVIDE